MLARDTPIRGSSAFCLCAGAAWRGADGGAFTSGVIRSWRRPLNTASRNRPSSVTPPYAISAGMIGSSQVAFGFLTGIASGDFPVIRGSSASRTSRATFSV
jgi:hypothetical protein